VVLSEESVVYFRKLSFETSNDKICLRIVKSKKIRGHLGGNLFQSGLEPEGGRCLSQSKGGDLEKARR